MISIAEAMEAAEARKAASLGDPEISGLKQPTHFQRLAVFSGLDVDHGDLVDTANRAGYFLAHLAAMGEISLPKVFEAGWVDAFLTGILFHKLTEEQGEPDT
jgi:hypothetical protein